MEKDKALLKMEEAFRKKVQGDKKVRNAYLLVHSDKLNIHLKLAEGKTGMMDAHPDQPNYMASVGKLFTSTIIAMLYEEGKIDFSDSISRFVNSGMLTHLHYFNGKDNSKFITVSHLLNHTSGLGDNFWPLLDRVIESPDMPLCFRDAIEWTKTHSRPIAEPGKTFHYTDTNYHLLALIAERVTGMPFHEILRRYIFGPLNMKNSWMLHQSIPLEEPELPVADFYLRNTCLNSNRAYANIDHAGGGVVATLEDLLVFLQALQGGKLIKKETLGLMMSDTARFVLGIEYGYGIHKIKTVPLFMPAKFNSWGHMGATGSFLFFHPQTESCIMGSFNEGSWEKKAIRFMLFDIIRQLARVNSVI